MIEDSNDEVTKNREAESAYARKELWGETAQNKAKKQPQANDMRQTVLGDLQTHNYSAPSSVGKVLLGLGLMATGVGGGTGAYFIADALKNKPATTPPAVVKPAASKPEATVPDLQDTDTVIEWTLE